MCTTKQKEPTFLRTAVLLSSLVGGKMPTDTRGLILGGNGPPQSVRSVPFTGSGDPSRIVCSYKQGGGAFVFMFKLSGA